MICQCFCVLSRNCSLVNALSLDIPALGDLYLLAKTGWLMQNGLCRAFFKIKNNVGNVPTSCLL